MDTILEVFSLEIRMAGNKNKGLTISSYRKGFVLNMAIIAEQNEVTISFEVPLKNIIPVRVGRC